MTNYLLLIGTVTFCLGLYGGYLIVRWIMGKEREWPPR